MPNQLMARRSGGIAPTTRMSSSGTAGGTDSSQAGAMGRGRVRNGRRVVVTWMSPIRASPMERAPTMIEKSNPPMPHR